MGEIAADLLKHPEVTRQVALRANKFVLSNYSWKAISGQLEKIYEQAKNQTP